LWRKKDLLTFSTAIIIKKERRNKNEIID